MARLFTDALRDMRNGRTVTELTEELAALVAKVKETGRPGELKVTIDEAFNDIVKVVRKGAKKGSVLLGTP